MTLVQMIIKHTMCMKINFEIKNNKTHLKKNSTRSYEQLAIYFYLFNLEKQLNVAIKDSNLLLYNLP